MQDRLLECYVNSPEMRFLILQFKIASAILDDYPDNVAFEILRQLSPIADVLPIRTYKLLQQCQNRCALYPLNNQTEWVIRYTIGPVRSMHVSSYVTWILMERKLLAFYSPDNKWLTAKYIAYDLNNTDYTHMSCSMIFVCVYSSRTIQVLAWNMHTLNPVFQIDVDEAIHVAFVEGRFLIVCSRQSQLVEVWNCLSEMKIETFHFNAPLRHCTTVVFSRRIMRNVAVTKIELDSNDTYYLKLIEPIDPNSDQNRFKLCRSPNNKPAKNCVLWKSNASIFYDEKKTVLHLNEFSPDLVTEQFDTMNNVPPVTNPTCVTFSKLFETAVVWFTDDGAVILHTCGNYFTIPGCYDDVCLESYGPSGITDVICLYNSSKFKFSFFQWKCSQKEHQYRLLGHLQLGKAVQYYGWRSDLSAGLILHCILNGTEFHTYYVTVANNLPNQVELATQNSDINQFEIFNNHIVTSDRTHKIIKVFQMSHHPLFINQFQLAKKISQMILNTSHILLVDSDKTIFVYSIDDSKTSVFTTNRFQYDVIRVYSLPFIFFIVNGTTSKIFALDVQKPLQLVTRIELKFSCRTLITSFMPEQSSLSILSEDQSVVATWDATTDILLTTAVDFDDHIRIKSMFALPNAFVFHSNNRCVYVQMKNAKESSMDFGSADLIATRNDFLALFDRIQKKLSIYNLATKQRGERYPNILCDILYLTDDGKYLFGISSTESMVVMYDVHSGKRLERLFIENLSSSCVRAINDLLVMNCNEKLCSFTITGKNAATLVERDEPLQRSLLFEKRSWSQCYEDEPWIDASNQSS